MSYEPRPKGVTFVLDLTRAYDEANLEAFIRAFDWSVEAESRSATLRLTDTFKLTASSVALEECFISLHQPILDTGTATWNGHRGSIKLHFDREQFEPSIELVATHTHRGEAITVYRLRLHALTAVQHRIDQFVFVCRLSR